MPTNTLKKSLLTLALLFPASALAGGAGAPVAQSYPLTFDGSHYTTGSVTVDGKKYAYRAYHVVYVQHPVDTTYQSMNIYIPTAYFSGQKVGLYTAKTAPIFLPNQVGGYMPGKPGDITKPAMGGSGPNAMQVALSRGFVVASPGARGRTNKAGSGTFYGKAPAAIVDLKAAVAYLHYNDKRMPGQASKIISNGTSAGGALSALLGATGDNRDYLPYLRALGAAPASDAIFAVSAYCPITNLDHADAAYEWEFNGITTYQSLKIGMSTDYKIQRTLVNGTLTAEQIAVSDALKPQFAPYVNSLKLTQDGQPLTLDAQGNGTFKDYLASLIQQSAQKALDSGSDLSKVPYLTVQNGKVGAVDFDAYVKATGRMKTPPAFDGLSLENGENQEFGTATVDNQHFTTFGLKNDKVGGKMADAHIVAMMNPINYLGDTATVTAPHWRIRSGTADKDTSHAVSAILATKLQNLGYSVDYALPWNVPHSGDYDLSELFAWADGVVRE